MKQLLFVALVIALVSADYFTDPPVNYPVVDGWYKHRATHYYDFGPRSPSSNGLVQTSPLIALVTRDSSNNSVPVVGQHNIAGALPGDAAYSDLWQIVFLTVPSTYTANTVTDATTAMTMFGSTAVNGPTVNCPVVPLNSTLAGAGPPLTLGWYQNKIIHYFDFGVNPKTAIPIYLITGATPAQHNIIDFIQTDPGYSAFWTKTIYTAPSGYVGDSAKAQEDLAKIPGLGAPTTGPVVNCPVVATDTTVNPPADFGTTGKSDSSIINVSITLLVTLMLYVLF